MLKISQLRSRKLPALALGVFEERLGLVDTQHNRPALR
jgi:hypothetical protein